MLCVYLLLSDQIPPKPAVKTPSAEVEVVGRFMQLPALPTDVAGAHAGYGKLRDPIQDAIKDLERNLAELYAANQACPPLVRPVQVPMVEAEEATFLWQLLRGTRYNALEKDVEAAWDEWNDFLVDQGLATRVGTPTGQALYPQDLSKKEEQDLKKRLQGQGSSAMEKEIEASSLGQMMSIQTSRKGSVRQQEIAADAMADLISLHKEAGEKLLISRRLMVVANHEGPKLAAHWTPYSAYLNDCAVRLTEFERTGPAKPSQVLQTSRLKARIYFLERYRYALWFCANVWARMDSDTPPRPLKEIAPTREVKVATP